MSASWNSKNRRVAKQLSRSNWYKGKSEVEPPTPSNPQGDRSNRDKARGSEEGEPGVKKTFHKAGQEGKKNKKRKEEWIDPTSPWGA